MEFPPLDDPRWDDLLRAVVNHGPIVGAPDTPLATSFPVKRVSDAIEADAGEDQPPALDANDLDGYAGAGGTTEVPSGRRSSASS